MSRVPIGLQLFSVREDCAEDLPATLKAVAAMGYEGVEFAGYYDHSARELRDMLDEAGLKAAGTHLRLDAFLGDELDRTVEFCRVLGSPFAVCSWVPAENWATRDALSALTETFNGIAERLRPTGLRTGYHNHAAEFEPLDDGGTAWDVIFSRTHEDFIMQIDTGNAMWGGADPVPFVERYPGRAVVVHLKEWSAERKWVPIGEGDIRWEDLFRVCAEQDCTEWYIVEQSSPEHTPLECVELCLRNLKKMGL